MRLQLTPHFNLAEFDCHDGTPVPPALIPNVRKLAEQLEIIRAHAGAPLHINSGYRTPAYNSKVGGVPTSQHIKAKAADITCRALSPKDLHSLILKLIKGKLVLNGGVGLYPGFVHYDIRDTVSRWKV